MVNQPSRPSNSDSIPANNAHLSNQPSSATAAKDGVATSNHNTMTSHPAITNVAISHRILNFLNTEKSVENYGLAHQGNDIAERAIRELATRKLQKLLTNVARGEQEEARVFLEKCEKSKVLNAQEFLITPSTFTDYSSRTFNCTAYEYAYWAKDKHMCRMLEVVMDTETKAEMLVRINALDSNGLTYTQNELSITNSKGFNLDPLKKAYEDYIRIYKEWEQDGPPYEGEAAVIVAWMNVGKAQRDLPVHYVNEYFRKDRSFVPLPKFDEPDLPRELELYNCVTRQFESLFPLVVTASSGLGVDFAFYMADWGAGLLVGPDGAWAVGGEGAVIDLEAVSHLDLVRTEDRRQSHKSLEPVRPAPGMN